jgi:hypothetical protein
MKPDLSFLDFLKAHKQIEPFDYDLVVEWAVNMLLKGYDYKSLIYLATMNKPVNKKDVVNHVTEVLSDFGVIECESFDVFKRRINYHTIMIVKRHEIRKQLESLYKIYLESNNPDYVIFFSLHHAWKDLESDFIKKEMNGVQMYYEGATLENIEELVIIESKKWLKKN